MRWRGIVLGLLSSSSLLAISIIIAGGDPSPANMLFAPLLFSLLGIIFVPWGIVQSVFTVFTGEGLIGSDPRWLAAEILLGALILGFAVIALRRFRSGMFAWCVFTVYWLLFSTLCLAGIIGPQ